MTPHKIVERIFNHIFDREFEVCICYDSSFRYRKELVEAFSVLGDFRVSLSIMTWSFLSDLKYFDLKKLTPGFVFSESFFDKSKKHISDIRNEIMSLNWTRLNTLKAYIYVYSSQDQYQYVPKVLDDEVAKQLRHNGISRKNVCIENASVYNEYKTSGFKQLLRNQLKEIEDEFMYAELNNLKRSIVCDQATFESFVKKSNQKWNLKAEQPTTIEKEYIKLEYYKANWKSPLLKVMNSSPQKLSLIKYTKCLKSSSDFSRLVYAYFRTVKISLGSNDVKVFLENISFDDNVKKEAKKLYSNLVDIQLTAQMLAKEFNKLWQTRTGITVECRDVYLLQSLKGEESFELVRTCPNFDTRSLTSDFTGKLVLDAFSHFTYEHTNKELLVIDLKSYYCPQHKKLYVDEPVIFSSGLMQKYGAADLGELGIEIFFKKHTCNEICKKILY